MKTQEKNFFSPSACRAARSSFFLSSAQLKFLALVFISEGAGQKTAAKRRERGGYSVMSKEMGGVGIKWFFLALNQPGEISVMLIN